MAILTIPNSFTGGTAAVASAVNANFTAVKNFAEGISNGTNIDAGAVTAVKLDAGVTNLFAPIGGLVPFAGSVAPAGGKWMLADGSAISRTSYASLFALVGITYGVGDGSTTFNLPNLKGRVIVGLDATQTEFDGLGELGGVKTVTLTESQIPSHNHTQNSHNHTQNPHGHTQNPHNHTQDPHTHLVNGTYVIGTHSHNNLNDYLSIGTSGASINGSQSPNAVVGTTATNQSTTATNNSETAVNNATTATNNPTGGGQAHDNLQPYMVLNYLIRVA
jgi:microcystin-dependent protein